MATTSAAVLASLEARTAANAAYDFADALRKRRNDAAHTTSAIDFDHAGETEEFLVSAIDFDHAGETEHFLVSAERHLRQPVRLARLGPVGSRTPSGRDS
jgi:hypothetical protein